MEQTKRLDRFRAAIRRRTQAQLAVDTLKRLGSKGRRWTKDTLEVQLSRLNGGEFSWWKKPDHAPVLHALCEELQTTPEALLEEAPLVHQATQLVSPEWPALGAVSLTSSNGVVAALLQLGPRPEHARWFGNPRSLLETYSFARLRQEDESLGLPEWVVVPPGAGKSVVIAWHEARYGQIGPTGVRHAIAAGAVPGLDEAIAFARGLPPTDDLILEIARLEEHALLDQLVRESPRRRLTVLSSASIARHTDARGWREFIWSPPLDWVTQLTTWIDGRAKAAGLAFDVTRLRALVAALDPYRHLGLTPRDLLLLGEAIWSRPAAAPGAILARAVDRWAELRLVQSGATDYARTWLEACGLEALRQTLVRRFDAPAFGWATPLNDEEWTSLVPEDLRPHVVASPRADRRLPATPLEPNATMALDIWRRAGLMRPVDGGMAAGTPLVEVDVARAGVGALWQTLMKAKSADLESLGRRLLGRGRVDQHDAHLRAMNSKHLVRATTAVIEADAKAIRGPGMAALIEALFAAWGRHPDVKDAPVALLRSLFAAAWQLTGVARRTVGVPWPMTRPVAPPDDENYAFVADCWRWSTLLDASPLEGLEEWPWLFPGWFPTLSSFIEPLKELPLRPPADWTPPEKWTPEQRSRPDTSQPHLDRLLVLARRWTQAHPNTLGRACASHRLTASSALVTFALQRTKLDEPVVLYASAADVLNDGFLRAVQPLANSDAARVADLVFEWMGSADAQSTERKVPVFERLKALGACGAAGVWVSQHVSLDVVRAEALAAGIGPESSGRSEAVANFIRDQPDERGAALFGVLNDALWARHLARSADDATVTAPWGLNDPMNEAGALGRLMGHLGTPAELLGPRVIEAMLLAGAGGPREGALEKRLWQIAPERVLELLDRRSENDVVADRLLSSVPDELRPTVLQRMAKSSAPPPWLPQMVTATLRESSRNVDLAAEWWDRLVNAEPPTERR